MKQALPPNQENLVYKQYIRQKYNKYRHQNLRMSEAMVLEKIIREWGHLSVDEKVKLSYQYKQKKLIEPDKKIEEMEEVKVVTVPLEKKKKIQKSKQKKGKGAKKKKQKRSDSPSSVEETPQKSEHQKKEGNTQAREKAQFSQDQSKQKNGQIEAIKRGCIQKQEVVEEDMNQELPSSHQQAKQKEKIAEMSDNLKENDAEESYRSIQLEKLQSSLVKRQDTGPSKMTTPNNQRNEQINLINKDQSIWEKQVNQNSLQALLNTPLSSLPAVTQKVVEKKGKVTEYLTFYQQKFKELRGLFPQLRSFQVTKVVKQLWINEKQEKKAKQRGQITEKKRSHKKAPKKEKVAKQKILEQTIDESKSISPNLQTKNFLQEKPYDFPEDLWAELKKDPHKFLNVSKKTSG